MMNFANYDHRWPQFGCRPCSCKPDVCAPYTPEWKPFSFHKLAAGNGQGLPGAAFELIAPDGRVFLNISDANGLLRFNILSCIEYTLRESAPPPGYQPHPQQYRVLIDMLGRLFINGQLSNSFNIYDEPLPTP